MSKKIKLFDGFSILATLAGMFVLASLVISLLGISAYNQQTRVTQQNKYQVYYNNIAGTEFAMRQIRVDGNPSTIPTREFSNEPWSITKTYTGCGIGTLIVGSTESTASNFYTLAHSNNVGLTSCIIADITNVAWDPAKKRVSNLFIKRNSNCGTFNITGAIISWVPNSGEKVKKIRLGTSGPYQYNSTDLPSGSTFDFGSNDYLVNNDNNIEIERIEFDTKMDTINPIITIEWLLDIGTGCGTMPPFSIP